MGSQPTRSNASTSGSGVATSSTPLLPTVRSRSDSTAPGSRSLVVRLQKIGTDGTRSTSNTWCSIPRSCLRSTQRSTQRSQPPSQSTDPCRCTSCPLLKPPSQGTIQESWVPQLSPEEAPDRLVPPKGSSGQSLPARMPITRAATGQSRTSAPLTTNEPITMPTQLDLSGHTASSQARGLEEEPQSAYASLSTSSTRSSSQTSNTSTTPLDEEEEDAKTDDDDSIALAGGHEDAYFKNYMQACFKRWDAQKLKARAAKTAKPAKKAK